MGRRAGLHRRQRHGHGPAAARGRQSARGALRAHLHTGHVFRLPQPLRGAGNLSPRCFRQRLCALQGDGGKAGAGVGRPASRHDVRDPAPARHLRPVRPGADPAPGARAAGARRQAAAAQWRRGQHRRHLCRQRRARDVAGHRAQDHRFGRRLQHHEWRTGAPVRHFAHAVLRAPAAAVPDRQRALPRAGAGRTPDAVRFAFYGARAIAHALQHWRAQFRHDAR